MSGKCQGVRTGGFKAAYFSLPANKLKAVKAFICKECGWSETTWGNKLYGRSSVKKLEAEKLETIFSAHNLDVWTGEPILTKIPA